MSKTTNADEKPRKTPCSECPLRQLDCFRPFNKEELTFVSQFKRGELSAEAGSTLLMEGNNSPHLYTILSGWGFRYKTLEDGRRQILNFVMPGDFIGLQGSLLNEMQHTVEALSNMELCVFERGYFDDLYRKVPTLAFDITWLGAREEQMLDEHLLSIGRRTALERSAYLLAYLHEKASSVMLFGKSAPLAPMTQQLIADTLGLSIVHTNKTLRKLTDRKLIVRADDGYQVLDLEGLKALSKWDGLDAIERPFV
ncbi:MAG: Crp/Fnr family transcriptional regulator [Ahrensia sp.]